MTVITRGSALLASQRLNGCEFALERYRAERLQTTSERTYALPGSSHSGRGKAAAQRQRVQRRPFLSVLPKSCIVMSVFCSKQ